MYIQCIIFFTFNNFVASLNTLFTMFSWSFLLGFFSIFKYKFIWSTNRKTSQTEQTIQTFIGVHKWFTCFRTIQPLCSMRERCYLTCSVRSTDALLYFRFVSAPRVASRRRKTIRAAHQTINSQLVSESRNVWWQCKSCNKTSVVYFTTIQHNNKNNTINY